MSLSSETPPVVPRASARLHELDALRGVAALTVVLHHFVLMWPPIQRIGAFTFRGISFQLLYPLIAGHEAVILFFILSGLVLTLPYLRGRGQPYRTFLARRILRIYAPYLVALALAICGAALWHKGLGHGLFGERQWSQPVNLRLVFAHIAFLGVYDYFQFDTVIWSLIYEMRISIVFPALALSILRLRSLQAIAAAVAASAVALALLQVGSHFPHRVAQYNIVMTLHYAAFFVLGILLARHLDTLRTWYRASSSAMRWSMFILAYLAYYQSSRIVAWRDTVPTLVLNEWAIAIGAIGFILISLSSPIARRILNSAFPIFLGRISYSLYLLHIPVLLALTYAIGDKVSFWVQLPIFLAASLGLSYLFCVLVEEPFTRMGQRLGRSRAVAVEMLDTNAKTLSA